MSEIMCLGDIVSIVASNCIKNPFEVHKAHTIEP
jgi:hypothetical protein